MHACMHAYKHLVYSSASLSEMVASTAFNVSIIMRSLPVALPFFVPLGAASTAHGVISVTFSGLCESWYSVHCC